MAALNHHQISDPLSGSNQYQTPVVVLMVPFPAQSHLNQLLHLSHLICSSYQIPVHYAASATHSRQVRLRSNSINSSAIADNHIQFHELPTPPFLSPPPNPSPSTKFPVHLAPSLKASVHLRQPVAALLRQLSSSARRLVVIHDSAMSLVVQDVAFIPNTESYAFQSSSAFCAFCFDCQGQGKPFPVEVEPEGIPSGENCFTSEMMEFFASMWPFTKLKDGDIFNTCRAMEGTYLDHIAKEQIHESKKHWAIAPLCPVRVYTDNESTSRNKCLVWLDKQPPKSVIYVCFGSTTSMADEEIKELALGLEESKQKFLWVLRDADRGDIFSGETRIELPDGFEDRVKEVGMVIREWAPQLEILGHPSVGGFMSHCGWNSCMESLTMGVPMATWPMHSDQPHNALLITKVLKVGVPVSDWAHRNQLVTSSTIKKAIEGLMASDEGDCIRQRAQELGSVLKQSVEEGGISRMEMDSFIAHITR